jgi:glycosyltransferase involved in cell wall biosynthesis
MMRIFINGLAASAGGGLTYLRNVIPHLAQRRDVETTILLGSRTRKELGDLPNVSFIEDADSSGVAGRVLREQTKLPNLIRRNAAQVLISTGNFALWNCPVPQILLSRNSLYTSPDFLRDVWNRRDYTIWLDTLVKSSLARRSIRWADCTVAPSEAFAQELQRWSGANVLAIHHGFDQDVFKADTTGLPDHVQRRLDEAEGALRLLFVSHYNYYRNFETLFRALPVLSRRLKGKKVKLFLTCKLDSAQNPGSYRAQSAASVVAALLLAGNIVELGTVPYHNLHHLYSACHIYVTPAYAESFAHPLIEAMSSGLPVVASDLPVHREICRDAATYFPRFSPEDLAQGVIQIQQSPDFAAELSRNSLRRAQEFSWHKHVERLLALAEDLSARAGTRSGSQAISIVEGWPGLSHRDHV